MLTVKENGDFKIIARVRSGGSIQDVTGWTFVFLVVDSVGSQILLKNSPTEIVINDGPNGTVWVFGKPADTVNKAGKYNYELEGTDPDGLKYPLDDGAFIVTPSIIKT
jgi:hypothetical protein